MQRHSISLLLILFCGGVVQPALAEVWQWRDEQGVLHFSDLPPSERRVASPALIPPTQVDVDVMARDRLQRQQDWLQLREAERKQLQAQKAQEAKVAEARNNACRVMLGKLTDISRSNRFYDYDASGKRVYLDTAEVNSRQNSLQQKFDKQCAGYARS
ncbi:DUF4124 domain-containing protein [Parathalassolituus penaei]|uniref:DUF4124 domain-containing protein n=1 Tax=Parathalassolituus penaei TaxID=2997323 RepID=A0A9X3EFX2_9GAMM|nr:DUF4124 domain-containing protein [Parathalassolituus penaei]MCY0966779.1 DUF4124 domain-containing protein [Parathalassolituus penaei]